MTLQECFDRRQLRVVSPDALKSASSIETAEDKLKQAKELASARFGQVALVTTYASMFHAGRALLYRDGVQEKSHFCLVVYLREKYGKPGKLDNGLLTVFDALREERHDVMYGVEKIKIKKGEIEFAIKSAESLITSVKKLLGNSGKA